MNTQLRMRTITIVDTVDTKLDWQQANAKKSKIGWKLWLWLIIPFLKWETVLAPQGTPCAMTTIEVSPKPIYQYKIFRGSVYDLGPEPAPEY